MDVDIAIIGAGIAGINASYRVQTGLPHYTYTVLEGRHELGGTWSLFKYPGVRSDSDAYCFSFPWSPLQPDYPLITAKEFLSYMKETTNKFGIDKHIQFNTKVARIEWKSKSQKWNIETSVDEKKKVVTARYIIMCTGYYDYNTTRQEPIPGIERFKGQTIHPIKWPEDLKYDDKRVTIVGSGATAATLVPAMVDKVKHITQVQRSPGWYVTYPAPGLLSRMIMRFLPTTISALYLKYVYAAWMTQFFMWCRMLPSYSARVLKNHAKTKLPINYELDPNFQPRYNPWEQRMLFLPNDNFYDAMNSGKADIVTGKIKTIDETGVEMENGQHIDTDILVTATGLKMRYCGGIDHYIDGQSVKYTDKYLWRGAMVQDFPNYFYPQGYINNTWTLGADATAQLAVRMMKTAEQKHIVQMTPRVPKDADLTPANLGEAFSSTYITEAANNGVFPKMSEKGLWSPRWLWHWDIFHAKFGNITDGIEMKPAIMREK